MLGRLHTLVFRAALVVTCGFLLVAATLALTGARLEPVLSGSMTPAIPRHALVLAVPVRAGDLRVGDVVVFQPPGSRSSVMHRIVELADRGGVRVMRTRGDANAVVDPWTIDLGTSRLHRVRGSVPHVGAALEFLHNTTRHTGGTLTWPGLLLLIGVTGYALRLRRREPDGTGFSADDLWAAGHDIVLRTERLAGQDLTPQQLEAVRAIAENAERVTALAHRLGAEARD